MTEQEFLERFDKGEKFSESELDSLRWEFNEVETIYGDNKRWSRFAQTIFEVQGRLFALDWEEGLTENQENEFFNQPYEVEKRTKVIEVDEYAPKAQKD